MSGQDLWVISPALAMAALAGVVIVLDLVVKSKRILPGLATLGMAVPFYFSLVLWFGWVGQPMGQNGFFDAVVADRFALFFQFLIVVVTGMVVVASTGYVGRNVRFKGEFLALLLLSAAGMMVLVSARELITIYVALELTSLPMVALAAIMRDERSSEAGLKFLILSGISSAVLLYGMVFVYGYTGTTDLDGILREITRIGAVEGQPFGSYALMFGLVAMVAGFAFKMAVVPFHMWVPDVYEGAPTPVTAYLSVASKAAAFAVVMRVLYSAFGSEGLTQEWSGMLAVMAAASMLAGNLLALWQRNIKRMLAYSTIAHAGYILMGLAAVMANTGSVDWIAGPESVLFYLGGYAATNLAAFFAVIAITNRTESDLIDSFAGMGRRAPLPALFLAFGLFSLLGMPPTVGFMAKAFVFSAAVSSGLLWLAVLGAVSTAISAFYYLRVVRVMYLDKPETETKLPTDPPLIAVAGLAVAGIAVFGVGPWLLIRLAEQAVRMLPSLPGA